MLFEMIGQAIYFENGMKYRMSKIDESNTEQLDEQKTLYICEFISFTLIPLSPKQVQQIYDQIKNSSVYKKTIKKPI